MEIKKEIIVKLNIELTENERDILQSVLSKAIAKSDFNQEKIDFLSQLYTELNIN